MENKLKELELRLEELNKDINELIEEKNCINVNDPDVCDEAFKIEVVINDKITERKKVLEMTYVLQEAIKIMKGDMKEIFKRYVALQYSGLYNMITQANCAMEFAKISREDYLYIIEHYNELKEKFKEEFEEGKRIGNEIHSQNQW